MATEPASGPVKTLPSGDKIPLLGFGTFLSTPGEVGPAVKAALAAGYRHIDCAKVYGNEKEVGAAMAEVFADPNSGITRQDVWITSKLPPGNATPTQVRETLESTLADLQLEQLDLYLVHQPIPVVPNPNYDGSHRIIGKFLPRRGEGFGLQDVWRAMESCIDAKLTRNIGVSNYNAQTLNDCLMYARIPPAMNQVERHPYHTQLKFLSFCSRENVSVTAYAPLGAPGSYGRDHKAPLLTHPVVSAIGESYGKTPAQVLIRWSIDNGVCVIPKSVKAHRIQENFNVLDFKLKPAEIESINALDLQGSGRMFGQDWMGVPTFT